MADSKIRWNGTTEDGRTTSVVWGSNPYTWGDIQLAAEVAKILGGSRRKKELAGYFDKDLNKKKRFIHLICRIKGEKVYDDSVEVKDVDIKVEDAELVVEQLIGKVKLEIKSGI